MDRSTTLVLPLGFGVGLLVAAGPACSVQSIFTCVDDMGCQQHGDGGVCEPNSFCTFPDESCPGGKRWHDRAGDLAGECFEVEGGSGTGGGATGTGSSGEATADDDGGSSDSNPVTTAGSSSGEPPDPSTGPGDEGSSSGGGGSSTGAAGACDAQYGAATDYMLCEELPESCMFSVTTAMTSCTTVCTDLGGTCITAHTNDVELCTPVMEITCDDMTSNDQICVCSNGA